MNNERKIDMKEKPEIEIRANNTLSQEECAICGDITEPQVPVWVFMRGTYEAVCAACAEKYSPDNARLLDVFYAFGENAKAFMNGSMPPEERTPNQHGATIAKTGHPNSGADPYNPFVPVSQGFYLSQNDDSTEHRLLGFVIYNNAGMPKAITTTVPVVAWHGDRSKYGIFKEKRLDDMPF